MENFWSACLGRFEKELSAQQFNTWIKPLSHKVEDNTLLLLAPNRFVQQWVKDRFLPKIHAFAKETLNAPIQVDVLLMDNIEAAKKQLNDDAAKKP